MKGVPNDYPYFDYDVMQRLEPSLPHAFLDKNRLYILKIEHECHNEKSPVAK